MGSWRLWAWPAKLQLRTYLNKDLVQRENQSMTSRILFVISALAATTISGQTVSLAGTADGTGRIAEFNITGSFSQIDLGDGGPNDNDGFFNVDNPSQMFGAGNMFPNEQAFGIGSLGFDAGSVTGVGIETVAATGIDLSSLWSSGSATSDISDAALRAQFFEAPTSFVFGALDGADTLTFTDGALTSIDISITASFVVDYTFAGAPTSYDGTFSISGNRFALFIDETEFDVQTAFGPQPQSRFLADVRGTVAAVVPAPYSAAPIAMGGLLAGRRRRS
ncbi:MAG: hypothetical protein AAF108_06655 [Planctomycetota bacterium]